MDELLERDKACSEMAAKNFSNLTGLRIKALLDDCSAVANLMHDSLQRWFDDSFFDMELSELGFTEEEVKSAL